MAVLLVPTLWRLVPSALPTSATPGIDLRVLAFAAALTLVTALAFGLAPMLRTGAADGTRGPSRREPRARRREGEAARRARHRRGHRVRGAARRDGAPRARAVEHPGQGSGFPRRGCADAQNRGVAGEVRGHRAAGGVLQPDPRPGARAARRDQRRLHQRPADGLGRRHLAGRDQRRRARAAGEQHGEHALRDARLFRHAQRARSGWDATSATTTR